MAFDVNFYYTNRAKYDTITPDQYSFYYITDSKQLYLGDLNLTDGAQDLQSLIERVTNLQNETQNFTKIYSDTKENWDVEQNISEKNVIYVYTNYKTIDGKNYPAIKIGDGLAYIRDLPFASGGTGSSQELEDHIQDTNVHIQTNERDFWNQKVTCYSQLQSNNKDYTLIFSQE